VSNDRSFHFLFPRVIFPFFVDSWIIFFVSLLRQKLLINLGEGVQSVEARK
jgi:hypothetical protein